MTAYKRREERQEATSLLWLNVSHFNGELIKEEEEEEEEDGGKTGEGEANFTSFSLVALVNARIFSRQRAEGRMAKKGKPERTFTFRGCPSVPSRQRRSHDGVWRP